MSNLDTLLQGLSMGALRRLVTSVMAARMPHLSGAASLSRMQETQRYPEWRSKVKARGRHDASQRSRSNRRKGARKAAAR